MICLDEVGIEGKTIESSCGHSEVAFQHHNDQHNPCQSKWDEQKDVYTGTLHTLKRSKNKGKVRLTGSTQDSTAVEYTLLVLFIQAYLIVLRSAVVKRTVCVDYHFI